MSAATLKMTKSPTTGTMTAKIDGASALNATTVFVHYVGNTLGLYGDDNNPKALLTSVSIEAVKNVKSGTYVLGKDSEFQKAWVRYNGSPYIFNTESATLHIITNHLIKHSSGTCTITASAFNDPNHRITVEVDFDLNGGTGIP